MNPLNPRMAEFVVEDKLGQGAFGVVYLVKQRKDNALFALKEIDLRKPGMQQVMKEVETMKRLPSHRNIVKLHDHWESASKKDMWLLLEYCSKGTLSQFLLASDALSHAALLDLSCQMLQALCEFEHQRKILQRLGDLAVGSEVAGDHLVTFDVHDLRVGG